MEEPRKLKGHKASTTCSIASQNRPGLIATAAEDGCVCWFDLRCKDSIFTMDVGNGNPVSSLCFKPGNEDVVYVSSGNEVKCFDVNMVTASKLLHSYNYNKDEINQIACNSKSSYLAAADDSGDVKIIDIRQSRMYKTLRAGHTSICSSAQFIPWRPWEVITGGLDSKLVLWDFSKGRPQTIWDFGTLDTGNKGNMGQCLNPAFVHALAVPEADVVDKFEKICVVARGDGVVSVIKVESEPNAVKSKSSAKPKKGSKSAPKVGSSSADPENGNQNGGDLHLDHALGGHTAAVSCVTFSTFGDKGKFIISGGNDKQVKVWDCSKFLITGETSTGCDFLRSSLSLSRKVNWLCTTPTDSENLVVCDTSKVVKVYTIG
uniref:WD repeat-containing protein 53 n=1 Tax=Nicotiana tabacum TaxID=4097 RepID=A0A1S4DD18_TOBAC|nr:PREDICTED: WD repeat-containing protein 53 [Nicotiana tabacum]